MMRGSAGVLALAAVLACPAAAQRPAGDSVRIARGSQFWPGPFIRVHRRDGTVRAGRLARVTLDTLSIRDPAGRPVPEPRSAVRAIEVRDRLRFRGTARGAAYGLAAAVVVVGAGVVADKQADGEGWILMGAAALAVPMPAIGAGIGFVFAPTRWRPAYVR